MKYFSKTTNSFYDKDIHIIMPDDIVEITDDQHISILEAQTFGKKITSDDNGYPITIDRPDPPLDIIKHKQKEYINRERDKAELSGFLYLDKMFDSNEKSIRRINTSVQAAQADNTLTLNWTLADNTTITLTAEQLIQMPLAMTSYGDTLHQKAKVLKNTIDLATTKDEVLAVTWE